MAKNNTLTYRVNQLEKNYDKLDSKMERLLTTNLPHINEAITALKTRINVLTLVNVGAIVLGIIFAKYF